MATVCQRWRDRRDSYRPAGETIDPARYEIAPIDMKTAKAFVLGHHYSASYPSCRFRYGLFDRGARFVDGPDLVGVAVFSHPMAPAVLTNVFPGDVLESVELGRFVLLDCVPGNAESFFKMRCRELLRRDGIIGIVAFSDDVARQTADGRLVFAGHIGTIYQASNAVYLGRGRARILRLLPDGRVFSERAISKIRNGERGWRYAVDLLVAAGAGEPGADVGRWLESALATVTRPLRHPGNHKYAWKLDRAVRLPASRPYPKRLEG